MIDDSVYITQEQNVPPPPKIVNEPFDIGGVSVPTRFFLAPMAGYTSLAYRLSVRENGGLGLVTTDLVNARSFLEKRRRAFELSETCPEDRPVAIQLYGHQPEEMCEAARRMVDTGASIIDINMGCPVRKVVKSGGGSALMCDTFNATQLVEAIVKAVTVPVTVKMRLGWDDQTPTAPELARSFEQVGVAAVIIHGRTRQQGFKGTVNIEGIARVVEAVERMPVVGNGDVRTLADAERMFRVTGCAAISIGRGALANPFFFQQLDHWARTGEQGPEPSFEQRITMMETHFHRLLERRGQFYACLQFRKTLKWYLNFTKMPKPLYLQLINLSSGEVFDEMIAQIRASGPSGDLPNQFDARIPVPSGPIDKW